MAFDYQSFATLNVNLNRQSYGPLDISVVFNSQADLDYYLSKGRLTTGVSDYWKDIVPYPYEGQIIAAIFDGVKVFALQEVQTATETRQVGEFELVNVGDTSAVELAIEGVKTRLDALESAEDADTTYTFASGTNGKFTVTPKGGEAQEIDVGITLPTKVSELSNDSNFQDADDVSTAITTALANYYDKTAIDALEEELDGKISAIPKFAIEVVESIESVTTPSASTVYLVPDNDTTTADVYDEYIYINNTWELLGKQTLDLSGYATKEYAEQQATAVDNKYSGIPTRVDALESVVGDANNGLVKDVADLKAVDIADLIATAKQEAIEAAAEAVPVQSVDTAEFTLDANGKLAVNAIAQSKITGLPEALAGIYTKTETDGVVSGAIETAMQSVYTQTEVDDLLSGAVSDAVSQANNNALVKSVESTELAVSSDGKLSVVEIAQSKVTGLTGALADRYTKTEADSAVQDAIGTAIGNAPTNTGTAEEPVWTGASGIYNNIYTKGEIADLIKSVTGGESAASVLAALNEYKGTNNAAVQALQKDVADLGTRIDTVNTRIDEMTINDIVEDFLILNGGDSSSIFTR